MAALSVEEALALATPAGQELLATLNCVICQTVARGPVECLLCRNIFCAQCIRRWRTVNNVCPFRCSAQPVLIVSAAARAQRALARVELRCRKGCGAVAPFPRYLAHLRACGLPPCRNLPACDGPLRFLLAGRSGCSLECLAETGAEDLARFTRKGSVGARLCLDEAKSSARLSHDDDARVSLRDGQGGFASAYSALALLPGFHRLRVRFERVAEHFKIGFASAAQPYTRCPSFCDSERGFGLYSLGQTRCGSDESGFPACDPLALGAGLEFDVEIDTQARRMGIAAPNEAARYFWHEDFDKLTDGPLLVAVAVRGAMQGFSVELFPVEEESVAFTL